MFVLNLSCVFLRGCEVSGVLCAHAARAEDGVRRGHPGRAVPSAGQEEGQKVLTSLETDAIQTVFLKEK